MITSKIIFIICCLELLVKRSENTCISWPKLVPLTKNYTLLRYLVIYITFITRWIVKQTIFILLTIGGIELNPGPQKN